MARRSSKSDPLAAFALAARRAACHTPCDFWFGDRVFIWPAWQQYVREGGMLGLDGFKEELVKAATAGLIYLARADLVEAMDPVMVARSQLRVHGAVRNFIVPELLP